jgi:hypothetical protein
MNAPFAPAHSPFGGSSAPRVVHCTASPGLIEKVPAYLRGSSADAERGTALHAVTAWVLAGTASLESLAGQVVGNYTITKNDVEDALRLVLAYVEPLLDTPGAEFYLEYRVVFPGIANTFGTCDLLVKIGRTLHVIDFKYGVGVLVRAFYPRGDEDVLNAQLLFYAAAARHTLREFFTGVENIVLTIIQPMSIEPDAEMVSSVEVTHAELNEFVTIYRAACEEALSEAPRLERGDWCRFCAARPICPLHTAPLLDLAQFVVPTPSSAPVDKADYLKVLAAGLALADKAKEVITALRNQAKRALENGDVVPGYALSAGRAERRWQDENAAYDTLTDLGLDRDDVIAETMRSPKQVEIRAKARGIKVPAELISSHRSGTSLVRCENAHVPVLGRDELVRSFSRAIETFRRQDNDE